MSKLTRSRREATDAFNVAAHALNLAGRALISATQAALTGLIAGLEYAHAWLTRPQQTTDSAVRPMAEWEGK